MRFVVKFKKWPHCEHCGTRMEVILGCGVYCPSVDCAVDRIFEFANARVPR